MNSAVRLFVVLMHCCCWYCRLSGESFTYIFVTLERDIRMDWEFLLNVFTLPKVFAEVLFFVRIPIQN